VPAASETRFNLVLDSSSLDRHALRRRDPELITTLLARSSTAVLDVYGERLPNLESGNRLHFRAPGEADRDELLVYLGEVGGREVLAVLRAHDETVAADGLRQLGLSLRPDDVPIAVTAMGIGRWHAVNGFCPQCGASTAVVEAGWVRRCPKCGRDHYPRTDPAVIMAVTDDDDRILLGRGQNFASKGMSVLAGFVEPGESLETAVAREVMEEVGVSVTDIQFLGDQPWPFPASLMVGFTCRATTTALALDPEEIAAARWFTRFELSAAVAAGEVRLSQRLSIARHIIEHWYGGPIDQPGAESLLRQAR
jgi:NAD+ diphosphatase